MVFREYSTQGRCLLQEARLLVVTQRNVASSAWLARSACPLVWGWYPEDRLTVAPIPRQKACHTLDGNWGPRSETMSRGISCSRTTWETRRSAVSAGRGGKVNHFREPIDHGQDGGVALGRGEACDEIQSDVGPWSTGDG